MCIRDRNNILVYATLLNEGSTGLARNWAKDQNLLQANISDSTNQRRSFWSPLRSLGYKLAVAEQVNPGADAHLNLVQSVSKILIEKKYLNTQEIAWGLLGVTSFIEKRVSKDQEKLSLNLSGQTWQPNSSDCLLYTSPSPRDRG